MTTSRVPLWTTPVTDAWSRNVGLPRAHFSARRAKTKEARVKAKSMHDAGYSYSDIGKRMAISRSYAHRLVKGQPVAD